MALPTAATAGMSCPAPQPRHETGPAEFQGRTSGLGQLTEKECQRLRGSNRGSPGMQRRRGVDLQPRQLSENTRPLRIYIAPRQISATQTRGMAGHHQRSDAHRIAPTAHEEMRLIIADQMITDDAIRLGSVAGDNGEIQGNSFWFGPM